MELVFWIWLTQYMYLGLSHQILPTGIFTSSLHDIVFNSVSIVGTYRYTLLKKLTRKSQKYSKHISQRLTSTEKRELYKLYSNLMGECYRGFYQLLYSIALKTLLTFIILQQQLLQTQVTLSTWEYEWARDKNEWVVSTM